MDVASIGNPCLICIENPVSSQTKNLILPLPSSAEENATLFNLVCKLLKIKLSKRNSWNFTKETLPFCHSCASISKELVEIKEQIHSLEIKFEEKVDKLRNLIFESEGEKGSSGGRRRGKRSKKGGQRVQSSSAGQGDSQGRSEEGGHIKEEDGADVSALEDERFIYFRRQVVGQKVLKKDNSKRTKGKVKGRGQVTDSAAIAPLPPKLRLKKKNVLEESIQEGDSSYIRRSERVKTRVLIPQESSDDDAPIHKQDFGDDCTFEHFEPDEFSSHEEESKKLNDLSEIKLADLKPEIEIKQELPSEAEHDNEVYEDDTDQQEKHGMSMGPSGSEREVREGPVKRKSKRRVTARKRRKYESEEEEGLDSGSDSDFIPDKIAAPLEDLPSSEYDSEGEKDSSIFRKWKKDKKSGRMWYDGVEVFITDKGLKCSKCDEVVEGDRGAKNKIKMKRHILLKHLEKFTCVLCDKVTSCRKYLEMHVKMVHEKSVNVPCEICGKPFTSLNAMRRHAWNHQNEEEKAAAIAAGKKQYGIKKMETMQCGTCGKMCKGPYNLKRHEETHIDQKERLKHMCQICGALYSAPETLRSHIKMAHENNNQLQWLQCPQCPKKYPQPGRLEKHMRSHTGEKPFKCPECETAFSQPTLLKVHMLKHKNLRPHKCQHCDMSFFRRYHMQRHTLIYHESEKPPTKKQPYRSENGTRKAPQKRDRKKATNYDLVERSETVGPFVGAPQQQQQQQPQPQCDPVDTQQIIGIVGSLGDTPQNFSFTSGGSFNHFSYSFSSSGINQQ